MAWRLTLKKRKKYHPPLDDSGLEQRIVDDKTNQTFNLNMNKSHISGTYAESTKSPSKTIELTNMKTYAEMASSTIQAFDENEIVTKAIKSAGKHNIKIIAGRRDRGYGNCLFEAVINNINDRGCFDEKLRQTPNWYRRNWMNEMMEKLLSGSCPWNPGYTRQEIREGFKKIQESGVYEIDYFGDMMIAGIACGIQKRILIFNTSENLLHDPVSVVDPKFFDVRIDIKDITPVVVAYNNYHYEGIHPVDDHDIQETIRLVNSYIQGRYEIDYGFTRMDIRYLVASNQSTRPTTQESDGCKNKETNMYCGTKEDVMENQKQTNIFNQKKAQTQESNKSKNYPWTTVTNENKHNKENTKQQQRDKLVTKKKKDTDLNVKPNKETETKSSNPDRFLFVKGKVKFEELENGSIQCGGCKQMFTRIGAHLNKSNNCAKHIDLDEFKVSWSKFTGTKKRAKYNQKKRDEDQEQFLKNQADMQKKSDQKKRKLTKSRL